MAGFERAGIKSAQRIVCRKWVSSRAVRFNRHPMNAHLRVAVSRIRYGNHDMACRYPLVYVLHVLARASGDTSAGRVGRVWR